MKTIKTFKILVSAIVLSSCHETNEPVLYISHEFAQLNTVIAPKQEDNDLLPWQGQYNTVIINSIEDIYATQTERFIEENQNWLQVDFSKKSIIAVRSGLLAYNYWQYTKVVGFEQINYDDDTINYNKGDYQISIKKSYASHSDSDDKDVSQMRTYQIAIVVDKIPSDANVHLFI
jgi:hypothetical protein